MDARTNRSTRKKVKDLDATITCHKLDGKDPIKVIGFLRRLKRDANHNDTTEGSLYLALPYMLKGEAQDAFEAAQDDGNLGGESSAFEVLEGSNRSTDTYPIAIFPGAMQCLSQVC